MPFEDLAAEVATVVRLLKAIQAELAVHAAARERHYLQVDPGQLARSLPGLAEIRSPVLMAAMRRPGRFRAGARFKSHVGLALRANETGKTDRKAQPDEQGCTSLLRSAFVRAAGTARMQDPQLAKIYYQQMTERGATHLRPAAWSPATWPSGLGQRCTRGTPYVISDTGGRPVTPAQAKKIIAERWTVPEDVRKRRRSRKLAGKAAFSHYAFAKNWEPGRSGAFREVLSQDRLMGPMIVTHTRNERAVGMAYALASRLAGRSLPPSATPAVVTEALAGSARRRRTRQTCTKPPTADLGHGKAALSAADSDGPLACSKDAIRIL